MHCSGIAAGRLQKLRIEIPFGHRYPRGFRAMSSHGHSVHHSLFPQRILKPCDEVGERLRTVCSIKKSGLPRAIHTGLRDLNANGDDLRLQANALQAQTQHLEHTIGATARGAQAHGQNELTRFKPKPYPKAHYGFSAMLQRAREVAQ